MAKLICDEIYTFCAHNKRVNIHNWKWKAKYMCTHNPSRKKKERKKKQYYSHIENNRTIHNRPYNVYRNVSERACARAHSLHNNNKAANVSE